MNRRFLLTLVGFYLFRPDSSLTAAQNLNFDYAVDLELIYFDSVSFDQLSQNLTQRPSTEKSTSNRTLGLRKFEFDLVWRHLNVTTVKASLRPDALLNRYDAQDTLPRELDTRAGTPYRLTPRIELLDTYELALTPGHRFEFGIGVYESLEPERTAYHSSLAFGLDVLLPQKFAAYRISWIHKPLEVPKITPVVSEQYQFQLWVLEGRDDRRERITYDDKTDDYGPSGADPFLGGAVGVDAFPWQNWRVGALGGYLDTKVDFGRNSEIFASLSADWLATLDQFAMTISYQSKWARERWSVDQGQFAQLEQVSHSLTTRSRILENTDLLAGAFYGISQKHLENDPSRRLIYSGYQYDFGIEYHISDSLNWQLLLSGETRGQELDGKKSGGFLIEQDDRRHLNRLAFAIEYYIP